MAPLLVTGVAIVFASWVGLHQLKAARKLADDQERARETKSAEAFFALADMAAVASVTALKEFQEAPTSAARTLEPSKFARMVMMLESFPFQTLPTSDAIQTGVVFTALYRDVVSEVGNLKIFFRGTEAETYRQSQLRALVEMNGRLQDAMSNLRQSLNLRDVPEG